MSLRRSVVGILISLLLGTICAFFVNFPVVKPLGESPILRVVPESMTVRPGQAFSVDVGYEDVSATPGVAGFHFNLTWNSSVLQCLSMQEVVFHAVTPQLEWDNIWMVRHDVENDSLLYAYTWSDIAQALDGGYAPISGNGTVATITFEGIAEGQTTLHFASVRCGDPDGILIPFLSVDGNVAVSQQPVTWVLEMPFGSKTFEVLVLTDCYEVDGSGFSSSLSQVYFNVTSGLDWFCNVTVPKTLLDGAFRVLIDDTVVPSTLAWNETHTSVHFNSTLSHLITIIGEHVLPIPGDLNYDAIVDVLDAIILANHFNEGV